MSGDEIRLEIYRTPKPNSSTICSAGAQSRVFAVADERFAEVDLDSYSVFLGQSPLGSVHATTGMLIPGPAK